MDPVTAKVLTAAAEALAKKTVQEPEKVVSGIVKIVIIISISFLLFLMIILSSLVGCFDGADLSADNFNPEDAEKYQKVSADYETFMSQIYEDMEERKAELLAEYTDTIEERVQVWIDGYWQTIVISSGSASSGAEMVPLGPSEANGFIASSGTKGKPNLPPLPGTGGTNTSTSTTTKHWVEGHWETRTSRRNVATARIIMQYQEVDISYVLAYVTVTEEGVFKRLLSYFIPDSTVKTFMEGITWLQEEVREISEEEREQAIGDEKYIKKEFTIYNEVLSYEDILTQYFPDDRAKRDSFKLSYRLYKAFMEGYQGGTNE